MNRTTDTQNIESFLDAAGAIAIRSGRQFVEAPDLLMALYEDEQNAVGSLLRSSIGQENLLNAFAQANSRLGSESGRQYSPDALKIGTSASNVLATARQYATSFGTPLNIGCLGFTLLSDTAIQKLLVSAQLSSYQIDDLMSETSCMMTGTVSSDAASWPTPRRTPPAAVDAPSPPRTGPRPVQSAAPVSAPADSPELDPSRKEGEPEEAYDKSVLFTFGRNLTKLAREGKLRAIIGRRKEIRRSIEILGRQTKSNPVLIGEPGVGKTAIAEGVAMVLVGDKVPAALEGTRLIELQISHLMAGASMKGEFEQRLKAAIEEASNAPVDFTPLAGIEPMGFQKWRVDGSVRVSNFNKSLKAAIASGMMGSSMANTIAGAMGKPPSVGAIVELCGFLFKVLELKGASTISKLEVLKQHTVLFIDEVHTLIGAGAGGGPMDSANILKPPLARGEVSMISATTLDEYKKHLRKDAAFRRRLQTVMVEQSSIPETVEIIQGLRKKMEEHFRGQVKITDEAIEAAAVLSHRYIADRFLPDKAIDLVDEAASAAAMALAEAVEPAAHCQIGKAEIEEVVHKITGVPLGDMREGESAKLLEMEKTLHQQVIGQHPAITAVSRAVRRARAGLKDPNKPIGSFLFLGPTGVGKTELARALQQFLFSNDDLIRLDMSEYQERHSVARLIGSPPGYVGFDEGGQLTEKVRRKPYSVVLLDEIEKAHPDVFNLLLQIMDDGRLTDGQGNTVDFKNVILIMTSNVGGHTLMRMPLEMFSTTGEVPEAVQSDLRYTFSPEFLNRIDRVVTFHRLLREHLDLIIEKMVGGLRALLANHKLSLTITGSAKDLILKQGWNEEYGARPLKRAIDQMLADDLSDLILRGEAPEGSEIEVSLSDELALFFQVKGPVSEAAATIH